MKARINGINIVYDVSGPERGPAVLLHHPLATNHTFWDPLVKALADKYRIIRLDARGHGQSDAPVGPYTFQTLAADVTGLLDHLNIDRASFIGLSMGGMVGQHLGIVHQDRFHCLVLVSTSSRIPPEGGALWDERIAAVRAGGMASQVEGSMARWVSPKALADHHPSVPLLRQMILSTPPEGYIGWAGAIRTLNVTDQLKAIKLPTRIIAGELDPSTNVAAHEAINKALPGSDLIVMKGVSHMLSSEAPGEFAGHVRPFLDKHAR